MANLKSRRVAKRAKVNAVTKRPKAKKKSKPVCPVVQALEGQEADIGRYNALCREWRKTPAGDQKEELADRCRTIRDVISGRWEAISHMGVASMEGAVYLLALGYADFDYAHTISDADVRRRFRRRARRCLYRGAAYIRMRPGVNESHDIYRWLMPHDENENYRLYHAKRHADELIAQAKKAGAS